MNRRDFALGAAAATGIMLVKPTTAFGYQANSAVRHGLLGCGNRGTAVATSFAKNTSARVVAVADLFPDNLAQGRKHFSDLNQSLGQPAIEEKHAFVGPRAFEKLAHADVDLIQISTPPFFHVEHLETIVASGKHVYCEKPVGIDVKQAQHALEIAKKVKSTQSVAVGFQCRNAPPLAAVAEKIKAGALGKVISVVGNYNAPASTEKKREGEGADEYRLRNWLWDRALSGDILVEQNIHIIDLCNWMLGAHPIKATTTGGRDVLKHPGNCWDHYEVNFEYADGVHLTFTSTQFGAEGFDAGLKFYGSEGMATAPYSGPVHVVGQHAWEWTSPDQPDNSKPADAGAAKFAANGAFSDNLEFADRDKERSFVSSITSNTPQNEIAAGVETALSCMLGRMAGLTGHTATWDDLMTHGESYELGMDLKQFA